VEEVFGPAFEYSAEGQEVHEGGVDVGDGVGLVAVIVEVVDLFGDEQFEGNVVVLGVAVGVEVEEVGGGLV
jgi:hypothetical protein